jgi:hypothetical protein
MISGHFLTLQSATKKIMIYIHVPTNWNFTKKSADFLVHDG